MSKELEALKLLEIEYSKLDYTIDIDSVDVIDLLHRALTPPTAEEVCKALSEQLKTPIKIGKNKHGITFNYVNKGKTLISLNYDLINITVQLPPHLITLIGRFYQNNYGNFIETLEEAK